MRYISKTIVYTSFTNFYDRVTFLAQYCSLFVSWGGGHIYEKLSTLEKSQCKIVGSGSFATIDTKINEKIINKHPLFWIKAISVKFLRIGTGRVITCT